MCSHTAGLPVNSLSKHLQASVSESRRVTMSLKLLHERRLRFGTLFGIGQSFKYDGVPAFSFVSFECEPGLPFAHSAEGLALLTEERIRPRNEALSLLPSSSKPLM